MRTMTMTVPPTHTPHPHPPHMLPSHALSGLPSSLHALTRPHMPSYTLLTSHAIAIAVTIVHPLALTVACPCMPSSLPLPLHALAHPPHFTSCHHRHCMPLHTLLPLHTITLACPLTLAISCLGPCRDWPPGSHRVK